MTVRQWFAAAGCAVLAFGTMMVQPAAVRAEELALDAPWYVTLGAGSIEYEGDEELKDGFYGITRLGYDYNEWWGLEGSFTYAPDLNANDVGFTEIDPDTGEVVTGRRRLADVDDTWGAGLAMDGLFHFTRWDRVDPYLTLGAGFLWYGEQVNGDNFDPAIRAGAGVMYHFNDEWAVRADARTYLAGSDVEANAIVDASVMWNWGARVPPDYGATGGLKDSDADGLPDEEEPIWKTDPYDYDSDDDGLSDGQEVRTYKTDPLNPDTDTDALRDGYDEVMKYKTNPLKRDTDDGGVADGHEVIEDNTNPLDGRDDLLLFELYIQFDYDKAILKPEFFSKLEVISKVLKRDPGAVARIEGHADKLKNSKALYNKNLSQRRAQAVLDHLVNKGGIERSRMTAVGYGFERPKAQNDPVLGNPLNRRVEIYIRESLPRTEAPEGSVQAGNAAPAP